MSSEVTFGHIRAAKARIEPFVHRTPLLIKTTLSQSSGFDRLFFKCEAMQRTGSFKIRGATNAVMEALEGKQIALAGGAAAAAAAPLMHFVTHSSGNHGSALARAARAAKCVAHVVVPRTAPTPKVDAMRGNGADIVFCEPNQAAREAACARVLASLPGSQLVHPYDDPRVIAGQGTLGIELVEQYVEFVRDDKNRHESDTMMPQLPDVVIVPVGGGGLLSGVSTAVRHFCRDALIIGAEPAAADDAERSFRSGRVEKNASAPPRTIADGLMTNLSDRTLGIILANVDGIFTVTEDEISRAMTLILQRLKVVIEPSAAVGAAVALFHRDRIAAQFPGRNLRTAVVVLCGGNVDIGRISEFSKL